MKREDITLTSNIIPGDENLPIPMYHLMIMRVVVLIRTLKDLDGNGKAWKN